jgi:ribosome maturation factor RimP
MSTTEGTKVPSFTLQNLNAFFLEEKIYELLAAKFQEEAFQDCFLVEFNLNGPHKLEVFIDCDSGLTFDKCRQISRYLESYIDQEGWLGEKYTLEVSSPGLTRPLKLERQYRKNIGRKVEVTLNDGSTKTGTLKAAGDTAITIEEEVTTKERKKKKTTVVQTELPFEQIKKTMIVISF